MATHYIPKDMRGETRILLIFTVKSLITTAIFALIGGLFFFIFSLFEMKTLGMIILVVMSLIGYALGTIKVPRIAGWNFTKNIEGDSLDEVIVRYIKFKMNRKQYAYTKEEE